MNHYAMMLCQSPIEAHHDFAKALELAKHACELTEYEDEICLATYESAKQAAGGNPPEPGPMKLDADSYPQVDDLTSEIIAHFEKRFSVKTNELALQNVIPLADVPVAVQTIQSPSSSKPSVIFTTGMSSSRMVRATDELPFAELLMIIPGDWPFPEEIDDRIWPWQRLQQLGYMPQMSGEGFSRKPQVVTLPDVPDKLGVGADFTAFLMLPNVKGYVDKYVSSSDRTINFILAMPIYSDEFEMASQSDGVNRLLSRIRETKTKPHMKPGRPSLVG